MRSYWLGPWLLISLGAPGAEPQGSAPDSSLAGWLIRYGVDRKPGGIVVPVGEVIARLKSGEALHLLDLRATERFAAFRLDGSRRLSLSEFLASGGAVNFPRGSAVLVIDDGGGEAVEAAVLLRLSGLQAVALAGGMEGLQRALADSGPGSTPARDSPVAGAAVLPPPDRAASPPDTTAASAQQSPLLDRKVLVVGASAAAVVVLLLLYFQFWVPRGKRQRLRAALAMLQSGSDADTERAEELLRIAWTAGLKDPDLALAAFALAYLAARAGRYGEALAFLSGIPRSVHREPADHYLELWLHASEKKWEEAVRLYQSHSADLNDLLDTAVIAGAAHLEQGRALLARGETDAALACFRRLGAIEGFGGLLPRDLDDQEVVLGIQALLDKNPAEAEKRFTGALKAAEADGRPTLHPRLGLLLCRWRASDYPDIDEDLRGVVAALPREARAGSTAAGEVAPDGGSELDEAGRLERDVLLWSAVSGIFLWLRLPEKAGLPAEPRAEVEQRLAAVLRVDPDSSDAHLLSGLIQYFFVRTDAARTAAVERLDRAVSAGVHLPEVRYLVQREKKLVEVAANAVKSYLTLLKEYLKNEAVPLDLRRRLKDHLTQPAFRRFRELGEVDLVTGPGESAPSLADLQGRGEIMHRRVERLLRPRLTRSDPEEAEQVQTILETLAEATGRLATTTQSVVQAEQALMVATGEFLFREEEGIELDESGAEERTGKGPS